MSEALVKAEGIIKADTHGRLRMTAERREFLLAEFERSAMTGRKFGAWAGIRYSTFGNWWRGAQEITTCGAARPGGSKRDGPALAGSGRGEAIAQGTREAEVSTADHAWAGWGSPGTER